MGFKIEGGVYDSRQLVLAWPDTYELPSALPDVGGSGGNEGNAGVDNKGDSTEGGQRPGLSQNPEESSTPESSEEPENKQSDSELLKEPVNEVTSAITKVEILENELSEMRIEFYEQQDVMPSAEHKATVPEVTETNRQIEKEMSDSVLETMTAIEEKILESTFSTTMAIVEEMPDEKRIQTDMQEKPERKKNGTDSRGFFIKFVCMILLGCSYIVVSRKTIAVKIKDVLQRHRSQF